MKIKINGIFDKYNTTVDLDKKCNIFIGENGVGKSTTMKIVSLVLGGKFVDLLEYNFESIELVDDKNTIKIDYSDLFPSFDKLQSIIEKYFKESSSFTKEELLMKIPFMKKVIDNDSKLYIDLVRYRIIYEKYDNNIHKDTILRRKIQNRIGEDYFKLSRELFDLSIEHKFIPSNDILNATFTLIGDCKRHLPVEKYGKVNYYVETKLSEEDIYKKIDSFINKYNKIFYISSVKNIGVYCYNSLTYTGDFLNTFDAYNKMISRVKDRLMTPKISKIGKGPFSKKKIIYPKYSGGVESFIDENINFEDKELFLKELVEENSVDEIIKNIHFNKKYEEFNIEDLYSDTNVEIGDLVFMNYYDKDTIINFLRDYYTMLKKMLNHEYRDDDLEEELFYENFDLNEKYTLYIEPLLPKNSFFRNYYKNSNKYYLQVYTKFIKDNLDKYMNYKSEKIELLNCIFKSYFKNKTVTCTPRGLIISVKEELSDELDFISLSEGERRIIIIFILGILCDTDVFLLDEPETSLSVLWQQSLVNDMLDKCDFKNLLIATQSPLIVSDDKLLDYVVCLPGGENNE